LPAYAGSPPPSNTLPTGGNFAAGAGVIAQQGAALAISQSSQRAVIDWKSFSIGSGASVTINNGAGATLNRVTGADMSQIAGSLRATGSMYLVNSNGVVIGPQGRIVTGGAFVAATSGPSASAFMQGSGLVFGGDSKAAIGNAGTIASDRGDVLLFARTIENTGTILAPSGSASLISAQQVVLTEARSGGRIRVEVPAGTAGEGDITTSGVIDAARVRLQAAGGNIYALAGKDGGLVQATGIANRDGRLWLSASGTIVNSGTLVATGAPSPVRPIANTATPTASRGGSVQLNAEQRIVNTAAGTIQAKGGSIAVRGSAGSRVDLSGVLDAGSPIGKGGRITVDGGTIALAGARLDASGAAGGGSILLGDTRQHATGLSADRLTIDAASLLLANAGTTGDGGTVSLWSTANTEFRGAIQAKGAADGRGGSAEVSSLGVLTFAGLVNLNGGKAVGNLLLDPASIDINVAGGGPIGGSIIDPAEIVTALDTANVTIANSAGGDIDVSPAISWSTANTLTLNSTGTLTVNAPITQAAPIGTTGGITLLAGSDIFIRSDIVGSGGTVNLLVNANMNGTGGGITVGSFSGTPPTGASMTGSPVTVKVTGDVVFGGGVAGDGKSYAVGLNGFNAVGVALLNGTTINAGGTVTLRGEGGASSFADGIALYGGTIVGAAIVMDGRATDAGTSTFGVRLGDSGQPTSVTATTGDIDIVGNAIAVSTNGVSNGGVSIGSATTIAATAGFVTVTGFGGGTGSSGGVGIIVNAGAVIKAGPAKILHLIGTSTADLPLSISMQGTLGESTSDATIILSGDRIDIGGTIVTKDDVWIRPFTSGLAIDVGSSTDSAAATLEISAAELQRIDAGAIEVGRANAGDLKVTSAIALTSVGTLTLTTGGDLTVGGPITNTVGAGEIGAIELIAGKDIYIGNDIVGNGGTVDLLVNANTKGGGGGITIGRFTGTPPGGATMTGAPVTLNVTGDVDLGGGTAGDGSDYAVGLNSFDSAGVALLAGTTIVAGGTVTINGEGGSGASRAHGIALYGGTITADEIVLDGVATTAGTKTFGVMIGDAGRVAILKATGGDIEITGDQSSVSANGALNAGIYLDSKATVTADSGSVLLGGRGGGTGAGGGQGIIIAAGAVVTASAGETITLIGSSTAGAPLAISIQGTVGSATSNAKVVLTGDRIDIGGSIMTTGTVSISPEATNWGVDLGSAVDTAGSKLELSPAEIGRISADVLSIAAAGTGTMTQTAAIDTSGSTRVLHLHAPAGLTQTAGSLIADDLSLTGTDATLKSSGNSIAALSANLTGSLNLKLTGDVAIDFVNGTGGVTTGGTVALVTDGVITLDYPIVANGNGDALTLSGASIINDTGPSALGVTAVGARWLAFTPTLTDLSAGGLTASLWLGTSFSAYSTGAKVGANNRFVLAQTGTLTVTPDAAVTTYGTTATPTFKCPFENIPNH